jgi:ketosteroid isomerase-like protein
MMTTGPLTTEQVIARHDEAFKKGDVDAIMADYAADAIMIGPVGVLKGLAAIRESFTRVLTLRSPGRPELRTDKLVIEGEVAYMTWSLSPAVPMGTDTFIVRNGKIVVQTVAVYRPVTA